MMLAELPDFLLSPDDRNVLIALQLMRLLEPQEIQDVLMRTYEQAKRVHDLQDKVYCVFNYFVITGKHRNSFSLDISKFNKKSIISITCKNFVYFARFISDSTKDVGVQEPDLYDDFKACFTQTLDYHGL